MRQPSLFEQLPVSVSELTEQIKSVLEGTFVDVFVVGEVSSLKPASSGHVYFNLKDKQAVIRAVLWRSTAVRMKWQLREGMEVILRGKLNIYAPRGDYSLVVDRIEPKGDGEQDLLLKQLKEKLLKLGYFAAERKRPLPRFPRRLALITSPTGAAIRDMLEILSRRWPLAEVVVLPVRVQGQGAGATIAAAFDLLNRAPGVDVAILGRGGGSREDLAAFNEEIVAQAIYKSKVPVISAVGHEIDVTVADLVADRRALTPSEAAELATPSRADLLMGLKACRERFDEALRSRLLQCRKRLLEIAGRRAFREPLDRLRQEERRLDDWQERLTRAVQNRLERGRRSIEHAADRLHSLSPLNVLGRGYSLTRTEPERQLVRDWKQVEPGQAVEILLAQGRLLARVEAAHESAEDRADL